MMKGKWGRWRDTGNKGVTKERGKVYVEDEEIKGDRGI
jgi:hypothetical protein